MLSVEFALESGPIAMLDTEGRDEIVHLSGHGRIRSKSPHLMQPFGRRFVAASEPRRSDAAAPSFPKCLRLVNVYFGQVVQMKNRL